MLACSKFWSGWDSASGYWLMSVTISILQKGLISPFYRTINAIRGGFTLLTWLPPPNWLLMPIRGLDFNTWRIHIVYCTCHPYLEFSLGLCKERLRASPESYCQRVICKVCRSTSRKTIAGLRGKPKALPKLQAMLLGCSFLWQPQDLSSASASFHSSLCVLQLFLYLLLALTQGWVTAPPWFPIPNAREAAVCGRHFLEIQR